MEPHVEAMATIEADEIVAEWRSLLSDVDAAQVTGEFGDNLAASFRSAFRHGPWGWYDDDLAFVRDWGFDLSKIVSRLDLAGTAGPDGADHPRRVAGRAHPGCPSPPPTRARPPVARHRRVRGDPRRAPPRRRSRLPSGRESVAARGPQEGRAPRRTAPPVPRPHRRAAPQDLHRDRVPLVRAPEDLRRLARLGARREDDLLVRSRTSSSRRWACSRSSSVSA